MALNWSKIFQNWTWHNGSAVKDTPLNATNLNKINDAIDTLDDRMVSVGTAINNIHTELDEKVTLNGDDEGFIRLNDGSTGASTKLYPGGLLTKDFDMEEPDPIDFEMSSTGKMTIEGGGGVELEASGGNMSFIATLINFFTNSLNIFKAGENKGYIGLNLSSFGSSIVLKKQDPSDTMTPVSISANALSQYYGTAQTPYIIQMGEWGSNSSKTQISSAGIITAQRISADELYANNVNVYNALNGKVDKNGTDRLMTADEGTKLAGIAAGAQVNVLEGVVVDSIVQPISGKKAFIDLSGKTNLRVIAFPFHDPVEGEPQMGFYKGAYVTYNGKLYEFTQEHTGAWNPSHVREIDVDEMYVRAGNGGYNNGNRATCEGYDTKASGNYSHAEGRETQAVGECTHAEGRGTIANSIYQHVEGKYNVADNESKYIHIIGNGIDANNRNNAFAIDWEGNAEVSGRVSTRGVTTEDDIECGGILNVSGADYAERFETLEDCPIGRFVTLKGEKIKLAQNGDFILGVTSDNPAIIGDKDNIGIPVGVIGKLVVEDDGTAQVDGFVVCGKDGIATAGTGYDCYRVMSRIDENHIRIWVK